MFTNKPMHFARAVEGVGFSTLSLATLGWRGYAVQILIRTIPSVPSMGFGRLKKPRKILVIRVTFDGKYYERSYPIILIEHSVSVVANFITTRITARILSLITKVAAITARSGVPKVKTDDVVAKYSDSVKINAKLK